MDLHLNIAVSIIFSIWRSPSKSPCIHGQCCSTAVTGRCTWHNVLHHDDDTFALNTQPQQTRKKRRYTIYLANIFANLKTFARRAQVRLYAAVGRIVGGLCVPTGGCRWWWPPPHKAYSRASTADVYGRTLFMRRVFLCVWNDILNAHIIQDDLLLFGALQSVLFAQAQARGSRGIWMCERGICSNICQAVFFSVSCVFVCVYDVEQMSSKLGRAAGSLSSDKTVEIEYAMK